MFEKANPLSASPQGLAAGLLPEDRLRARRSGPVMPGGRSDSPEQRRAGGALRAVEWSEITARLNAARDLRLLLRKESHAPIEAVAASFGDAAASYFALLDDSERDVNPDALGEPKALGATTVISDANRPGRAADYPSGAARDDAKEVQ